MYISSLSRTYVMFYSKDNCIFIRAIYQYITNRKFRTSVKIYQMLGTRNMFIKKYRRDKINKIYGCDVGLSLSVGVGLYLGHAVGVVIGDKTRIGNNCTIYQNVTIGSKNGNYPQIGNNVTIYPSSVVIGDIKIGDNAIIGAGSVVLHDVPTGAKVAGNPAKKL